MKRKEFLQGVGLLAAGTMVPWTTPEARAASWPAFQPDDERFWKFLRLQFPLTRDRAYFNTGGLGASPYAVIDAVKAKMDELEFMSETGHNDVLWKEIKTDIAGLLGCDLEEVAFIRNTTEGINIVANGLPLGKGDEIITTTHEHVGNSLTWLELTKRSGCVLKMFEPSTVSAAENLARLQALITRKTRLIAVPHVMTTTGMVLPVKEISALARARKIWSLVDGAQTAGMFPFSLYDLGCDAYATSGHKWLLGPKETGLLYVRREMWDAIQSKYVGAYSAGAYDSLKMTSTLHPSAQRYEYGTVSVPLRCGLHAGVRFLQRIGMDQVWARDRMLSTRLYDGLQGISGVEILSPADPALRSAMITFQHRSVSNLKLQEHLDTFKLRTRAVGEGGMAALRISTHIYNSPEEVDRVIDGVRSAS
jgi:selenocysteine lyase/cysteine desulfurase